MKKNVWLDIGCADFDNAARNRKLVANKECVEGYIEVERALERIPLNKPLPSWMPQGNIPQAIKKSVVSHEIVEHEQWENLIDSV